MTILLPSFYWDDFFYLGMGSKRGPDGKLAIRLSMGGKMPAGIAAGDIEKCALGIFKNGREHIGQTLGIAGEHLAGEQMAATLARALGQEMRQRCAAGRLPQLWCPGSRVSGQYVPVL